MTDVPRLLQVTPPSGNPTFVITDISLSCFLCLKRFGSSVVINKVSFVHIDALYSYQFIFIPIYPHYFELRYPEFQQRVWKNMETWNFLFYILSLVGHVQIIYHFLLSIHMYNRRKKFFYLIYQNKKSIKFQKWICNKMNQFFKSKLISIIRPRIMF